nr:AI-2E family transporter [Curtanaerobium respiraculi]
MQEPVPGTGGVDVSLGAWRRRAYAVWAIIGSFLLLFGFGYVLNVLAIPVGILIWSAVIVFCLRGLVIAIEKRGHSRMVAVTWSYIVLAVAIGAIVGLMSSPLFGIGDQFKSMALSLPDYISGVQSAYNGFVEEHPDLMQNPAVTDVVNNVTSSLVGTLEEAMRNGLDSLADIGIIVANSVLCIGFALVVAFWMLLALPDMGREIRRLTGGAHSESMEFIYFTFTRVVGGYIKGMLVQCGLITVACAVLFLCLGVPNAVAFAIITGILNFVPVVGPWLGGAAAGLAALGTSPFTALMAIILTVAVQQVVYTFVSPKIMSDTVDVHPMMVIFAMVIGLAVGTQMSGIVGGLTGMLLGIPAAALGKSLFVYFFEKRTGRTIVAPDGVFFKGSPSLEGSAIADATGRKHPHRRFKRPSSMPPAE